MLTSLLVGFMISGNQPSADADFTRLKTQLEGYGFQVKIAIPPDFQLPNQRTDFSRRRVPKPYGVMSAKSKSIWINPIVFELGNSNAVLVHEAVHAAQYCAGNGSIQTIGLNIEPIQQARPFFKRYVNVHSQAVEKEAYAVQTQPNSYELIKSLLKQYCQ